MDNKLGDKEYELNKQTIKNELLTPKEYEKKIKEMCDIMEI